ncbi:MAG: hypothetical protein R3E01_10350 [Pirellulaceae bacterium]
MWVGEGGFIGDLDAVEGAKAILEAGGTMVVDGPLDGDRSPSRERAGDTVEPVGKPFKHATDDFCGLRTVEIGSWGVRWHRVILLIG